MLSTDELVVDLEVSIAGVEEVVVETDEVLLLEDELFVVLEVSIPRVEEVLQLGPQQPE